jgi:phage replication-related protein YjqB (UPF0714/DUF867 family)
LSWERVVSATSIEMATGIFFIDSDITVHIASPDEKFGGDSLQNIVNRLTAGGANGIQIEQSPRARSSHWQDIADAVANVYNTQLG